METNWGEIKEKIYKKPHRVTSKRASNYRDSQFKESKTYLSNFIADPIAEESITKFEPYIQSYTTIGRVFL